MDWFRKLEDAGPWPARQLAGQIVFFGAWVAMTTVALALPPSRNGHGTHQALGLPPCPMVMATGKPCPGCGLTTCVSALVHGDFALAWQAHPVGVLLYFLFTVAAIWAFSAYRRKARIRSEARWVNVASIAALGVLLTYGIYRYQNTTSYATWSEVLYGLPKS